MLLFLILNKDARYLTVIVVMGLTILFGKMKIDSLRAVIAARPNVETKIEKQVETKTVEGPEKIVEHTVYVPGTTNVEYVDRIVTKEPTTVTTETKTDADKSVSQTCPDMNGNRKIVGLGIDPLHASQFPTLRGGYSFSNRLDLTGSVDPVNRRLGLEAALRFK